MHERSPFAINATDAAMVYATPLAAEWLEMIGQGGDRACRKALLPIFDAHRNAPKESVANLVDAVVKALSFASIAEALYPRLGPDKGADLAAFCIQRAKHMTLPTPGGTDDR